MPHLRGLTSVVMVGGFSGSIHVQVMNAQMSQFSFQARGYRLDTRTGRLEAEGAEQICCVAYKLVDHPK